MIVYHSKLGSYFTAALRDFQVRKHKLVTKILTLKTEELGFMEQYCDLVVE